MTEDRSFNAFLKAKLEEEVGEIPTVCFPAASGAAFPRRGVGRFLLAASLAAVCCVLAVHFAGGRVAEDLPADSAIDLLAASQYGLGTEGDGASDLEMFIEERDDFGEKLLAWQDAPYAEELYEALGEESLDSECLPDSNLLF